MNAIIGDCVFGGFSAVVFYKYVFVPCFKMYERSRRSYGGTRRTYAKRPSRAYKTYGRVGSSYGGYRKKSYRRTGTMAKRRYTKSNYKKSDQGDAEWVTLKNMDEDVCVFYLFCVEFADFSLGSHACGVFFR